MASDSDSDPEFFPAESEIPYTIPDTTLAIANKIAYLAELIIERLDKARIEIPTELGNNQIEVEETLNYILDQVIGVIQESLETNDNAYEVQLYLDHLSLQEETD